MELWAGILDIREDIIGIQNSFFDLGGHSLKATLLTSRIHQELNVKIHLKDIFTTPTIAGLAEYITKHSTDEDNNKETFISHPVRREQRILSLIRSTKTNIHLTGDGTPEYRLQHPPACNHHRQPRYSAP